MEPFIIWSIERFGTIEPIHDEWLRSPVFYADSSKVAQFCLGLHRVKIPSNSNNHVANLFLCRCDIDGPENVDVEYIISTNYRPTSSTYKRRFLKPQKGAYKSYETDALLLTTTQMSENNIKAFCKIVSYDDDKYASSGIVDRTDFDGLSHDITQMFLKSEFSDVVIRIQNHEFNVHKVVLDVRCPELLKGCQVKNSQKITQKCDDDCIRKLLRYIYSGKFLPREVPDDLHLLLKKCKDSIFEHLFPYFPIELHIRTSFKEKTILIQWYIEKLLMSKQNKEYLYIITDAEPSTWLSIIFLKDKAEFVIHNKCKKSVSFVHCKILIHREIKESVSITFTRNHLFIDDHPWNVELGDSITDKTNYITIIITVTDVKPTNSVEKVRYSFISGSHRHSIENVFQLSRDMGKLYKNPLHSDVTLIIKGRRISAHKVILSARSPRFHETLQQNNFLAEIPINDLDEKVALSMIYYIYNAQVVDLDTDLALELYKAADLYKIKRLKRKCSRYLELSLTAANVGEILLFADTQNDSELKSAIYNFIKTRPSDVLESKQTMGIMRSYHYLHLDALKEICRHLAKKVRKEDTQNLI